jgi:putative hydrolase of the HAD superfamily
LKCFKTTTVKYDFAIPVLKEIKNMGIKIALITNGTPELQYFKIKSLDMEDCFDEVIVSGETPYEKPDERIFQLMAEKLGIKTSEMLYIGDHPLNDIDGSRNAGCIPVWVKTTGTWIFPEISKPDLQVETVEEIPQLIKKINER